jgi:hypothetical protein
MSAQHTPGPWVAENITGTCWQIDAESDAVATTQFCYARETAANARLMAAAPDLLAALKEILPWHDSHPAEATNNPLINRCRAAIAKAEGRS